MRAAGHLETPAYHRKVARVDEGPALSIAHDRGIQQKHHEDREQLQASVASLQTLGSYERLACAMNDLHRRAARIWHDPTSLKRGRRTSSNHDRIRGAWAVELASRRRRCARVHRLTRYILHRLKLGLPRPRRAGCQRAQRAQWQWCSLSDTLTVFPFAFRVTVRRGARYLGTRRTTRRHGTWYTVLHYIPPCVVLCTPAYGAPRVPRYSAIHGIRTF
eukprot:SAG11_NODE_3211_length_2607_cov_1.677831_4_plen_218_part_00